MARLYKLDTNMASYIIKDDHPKIKNHLFKISAKSLCISAVTEAELLYGIVRKSNAINLKKIVEEFLLRVDILPWDSTTARHYALTRSQLESKGHVLRNLDLLIAAHALANNAILVTHDKAFKMVKDLEIEDWTQ